MREKILISGSDVDTARKLFSLVRQSPRGFTPSGTFGEVSAFFMGFCGWDGPTSGFTSAFQAWVGRKRDGRSELAFFSHVIRELFPELPGNFPSELSPDQDAAAVDLLLSWLDEFFLELKGSLHKQVPNNE
jgi:hypothetical protein